MVSPVKRALSSRLAWLLTGLTYPTAIIATNGKYLPRDRYVATGREEMSIFSDFLGLDNTILEFGCGPGKNLLGIADRIKAGLGIDVNPFYIRIANKLASRYGFKNLHFLTYDSVNFPTEITVFDVILEKGVFERLDKSLVGYYITKLTELLKPDGVMILYFLMEKARKTEFTKRLGESAYTFWSHDEVLHLLRDAGLNISEVINAQYADFYVCKFAQMKLH